MKKILYLLLAIGFVYSCDLDEEPLSKVSKDPVFSTENGLQLYTNSFYDILPSASAAHRKDNMSDFLVRSNVPDFIREGAYGPQQSDGWSWGDLRNINYFIQHCNDEKVPVTIRNNYLGLARFFRAYFYFEKVQRFGDVPWINKAMDVDDPDLYAGRDSRTLIMDSVLVDLNYAFDHITTKTDPTSSLISKSVVMAFKSRICLFEGTFRKYHTNYNLVETADSWLKEAVSAAEWVMENSGYSIYKGGGESHSYRQLFTSQKPVTEEVMLASICDLSLSVLNDANWYWTSSTYGDRSSLTRMFVHTYLMLDGTSFTDKPGYKTAVFTEEVKERDRRLEQTIRTIGYQRIDGGVPVPAPPAFSYTYTGYQPIKFCLDDMYYDSGSNNNNSIPLMRYAEVLLNYAEAKAELGTFTDSDWAETIGVLRSRAGITAGLTSRPTRIDPYLQTAYFPEISDASLLEIRRERAIELIGEGLRLPDLIRWKKGNLMEMKWNGLYVPALDVLMDLNEDGTPDVCFTFEEEVQNPVKGVTYVNVASMRGDIVNPQQLSEGTKGELIWLNNIKKTWTDKNYLYPVPESALLLNDKLGQNPGWTN